MKTSVSSAAYPLRTGCVPAGHAAERLGPLRRDAANRPRSATTRPPTTPCGRWLAGNPSTQFRHAPNAGHREHAHNASSSTSAALDSAAASNTSRAARSTQTAPDRSGPLDAIISSSDDAVLGVHSAAGNGSHPSSRASQWNSAGDQNARQPRHIHPSSATLSAHVRTDSPPVFLRYTNR